MAVISEKGVVSLKEKVENLESKVNLVLKDKKELIQQINEINQEALDLYKHYFKEYVDSYTKSQLLIVEMEKNLAIEDIKQTTTNMSSVLQAVSIAPLQSEMIVLNKNINEQLKDFKRKLFYMNIVCIVSMATALLSVLL